MRLASSVGLLCLAAWAAADRLIDIPTADKLAFGEAREEAWFLHDRSSLYTFSEFGIGQSLEGGIRTQRIGGGATATTFDFAYNYLMPFEGGAPGISVGVLDGSNSTSDGRRFYLATTWDEGGAKSVADPDAEITVGLQVGRRASPFVGASLPIGPRLRLMAEHDGVRINAGVEFAPTPQIAVRLLQVGTSQVLSLNLRHRF